MLFTVIGVLHKFHKLNIFSFYIFITQVIKRCWSGGDCYCFVYCEWLQRKTGKVLEIVDTRGQIMRQLIQFRSLETLISLYFATKEQAFLFCFGFCSFLKDYQGFLSVVSIHNRKLSKEPFLHYVHYTYTLYFTLFLSRER